jgi:hypothetical protein
MLDSVRSELPACNHSVPDERAAGVAFAFEDVAHAMTLCGRDLGKTGASASSLSGSVQVAVPRRISLRMQHRAGKRTHVHKACSSGPVGHRDRPSYPFTLFSASTSDSVRLVEMSQTRRCFDTVTRKWSCKRFKASEGDRLKSWRSRESVSLD